MSKKSKEFDLIVFGSNAFTGKLAARYIAENFPKKIRWAVSGRNAKNLQSLFEGLVTSNNPPQEMFTVDHGNRTQVFDLIGKTKVALTFAGPFGRYGENIVAACAELGTHYLDITGETVWVQKMIEKYEAQAQESGSILIPFSGFDSIPSDLGVWDVLQKVKEKTPAIPLTKVVSLFSAKGGVNGGTFETLLDGLEQSQKSKNSTEHSLFGSSALLVPSSQKNKFHFHDAQWPTTLKTPDVIAPSFFMAPINTRVVYRSQALRMNHFGETQPAFEYTELQKVSQKLAGAQAWAFSLGGQIVARVGSFAAGRKLMRAIGPKAGEGPSEKTINTGHFKARFFAYRGNELVAQSEIFFNGDPGNKATITMACESARCLLEDHAKLPKITGGFWTPSTALGGVLKSRLISAGMSFN